MFCSARCTTRPRLLSSPRHDDHTARCLPRLHCFTAQAGALHRRGAGAAFKGGKVRVVNQTGLQTTADWLPARLGTLSASAGSNLPSPSPSYTSQPPPPLLLLREIFHDILTLPRFDCIICTHPLTAVCNSECPPADLFIWRPQSVIFSSTSFALPTFAIPTNTAAISTRILQAGSLGASRAPAGHRHAHQHGP